MPRDPSAAAGPADGRGVQLADEFDRAADRYALQVTLGNGNICFYDTQGQRLTDDVWLYGSSMLQVQHTIRAGRNGNMPAQAYLGDDKLHMLAAYVYGLSLEDE